jgi:hypothetical protein
MGDGAYPDLRDPEMMDELTGPERAAIASLQRLAKRWPRSLKLLSYDSALCVIRSADSDRISDDCDVERQNLILADIDGIPNDGGGW